MFKQSTNQIKHGLSIFYKTFPFALRSVWQAAPLLLILVIFTTTIKGLLPMAVIWVGKQVLDSIVNAVKAGWSSAEATVVYQWLGVQLLVVLVEMLIRRGNTFLILIMGKRLSLNMRKNVLEKASSLDLATFEDSEFYDKITRARTESRGTPLRLIQRFQGTICGAITFFSMGTLIISLSPALFVVMILVCMPLLIVLVKYSEKQYQLLYTRSEKLRKIKYLSNIMTTRRYIPEIINLGLRPYLMHKWVDHSQRFYREDVQLIKRQNLAELSVNSAVAASEVGATGYVIFLGIKVLSLSVGEIVMYSGAFAQGLNSLRQGVGDITGMYEELLFLSNLIEFHRLEPHTKVKKKTTPLPGEIESIEIQNVSFKYPGAQDNVLKNITVTFKRSERTLLVGANGAGKTTLIKLIMRLYDPEVGRILINGIDIREFNMESLQQAIGVIFQDYVRYAVSAKENIGYGFINELENQNRIEVAAEMARADEVINRLPHKYDTILSKLFKNGQELSLGQWQRICLARLFMKKSPILIFDEPTARLDIETEEHLLHEINQVSRNRICILASHRMFQQGIADQIVVLKKGVLLEVGSYENLMAFNGEFARLRKLYHNITKEYVTNGHAVSDTKSLKLI